METSLKSNKENTRPKQGQQKGVKSFLKNSTSVQQNVKSFIKNTATRHQPAPLQSQNDQKPRTAERRVDPMKKQEQRTKATAAGKPVNEVKKATVSLSQNFHAQQSANYKKLMTQGPKYDPPKSLPGSYKGKVVQSKVDCFRRPGDIAVETIEKKTFKKPARPAPATLSSVKSKSTITSSTKIAPIAQTQSGRPKSVTEASLRRPLPKTVRSQAQTIVTTRQLPFAKRPPTSASQTARSTATMKASSSHARLAPAPANVKTSAALQGATKAPSTVSQRPVRKPVTSTLSHTRATMETAEERRAKLAEWLAKKGKTLKRPPIQSVPPTQRIRLAGTKPKAIPPLSQKQKPLLADQEAEPRPMTPLPEPEIMAEYDSPQVVEEVDVEGVLATSSPAQVMNTTLDMVDHCELDLPEVEVRLEDLVVNLCDALEALETPSMCESNGMSLCSMGKAFTFKLSGHLKCLAEQVPDVEVGTDAAKVTAEEQVSEDEEEVDFEVQVDKEQEIAEQNLVSEEASSQESDDDSSVSEMEADSIERAESSGDTNEAVEEEESEDQAESYTIVEHKVKKELKVEQEEKENKDQSGATTPDCSAASVVKFSVRTTPFLQSMKKCIDGSASAASAMTPPTCGSSRRRKSAAAIGDLKFLTPVRRSVRIERKSAHLPAALTEHDPCVTSLAQLAQLDSGASGDQDAAISNAAMTNAYIYRRNPALLEDLPEGQTHLTRL